MQDLYKINQIASLFSVSCDTLRLYEKEGLIRPTLTDENTKYRYYGLKEILTLDYIIQLKGMGITLSEIRKILNTGLDLQKRRELLENKLKNLSELLSLYDIFLNDGEYDIEIKSYPEHYAIKKDVCVTKWNDLISIYSDLISEAIKEKSSILPYSYPYAIFSEDFKLENFSCTACMQIASKTETSSFYPEQKFISLRFKGDYENLPTTYEKLYSYAKQNGIRLFPYAIERYIVAYDNIPLSTSYITEVNLPIA